MDTESKSKLAEKIERYVSELCSAQPDRHPGSVGNRQANEYVAGVLGSLGFSVERLPFECWDWEGRGVELNAGGAAFETFCGPYSPAFDGEATLVAASSAEELAAVDAAGCILLLHGELVHSQMTPKHYPFYQFEEHSRLIAEIERQAPAAIVAATGKNPGVVGGLYPFPFIEDADFERPSAFMRDSDGEVLLGYVGEQVRLRIDSRRFRADAEQVVARRPGTEAGTVVLSAHVDARKGTPGALDNAAGVACLLATAELLAGQPALQATVELVPFNGEDNYAAPGEVAYIASRGGSFGDVRLAINVDAAGFKGGPTALSFYGCPEETVAAIRAIRGEFAAVVDGPEWPQSDHMIFAMRGIPTLALTSSDYVTLSSEITHTERDVPELVDPELLAETAAFLADTIGWAAHG